jgi:hypothetical protein
MTLHYVIGCCIFCHDIIYYYPGSPLPMAVPRILSTAFNPKILAPFCKLVSSFPVQLHHVHLA